MDCIGLSRFGTGRQGRWLVVLLWCFVGWTLAAAPPTPPRRSAAALPRPAPDGHRFLFVVDVSADMRATDTANRQALFEMLFTGLDGQMRTGDTFGLWFYNDKLHAGDFPMQIWDETDPLPGATLATKFLRDQPYAGRSRPRVLVPPLLKLIEDVGDANVLVISHCKPALEGTPFDTNIAAIVRRKRADREQAQKPFVTALVARGGTIVTGAVVIAGEPILLPGRPASVLAAKGTNSPAPPTKPKGIVHSISTSESQIQGSKLLSTGIDPGARSPETIEKTTATPTPEPAPPPPTKPKVLQFVTHTNDVATNAVAALAPPAELASTRLAPATHSAATTPIFSSTPTNATNTQNSVPSASGLASASQPGTRNPEPGTAAANAEPRQPASPGTAPANPVAATVASLAKALEAEPVPVAAREPAANGSSSATAAVVAPTSAPSAWLLLTIGLVLLVACLGLLVLVVRRLRPQRQGSFISRSMEPR